MPQQDPLQAELLKRSWADPANRPPRDTWRPTPATPEDRQNAPYHQLQSIEDALAVKQPTYVIDANTGGFLPDGAGGLTVETDINVVLRHILAHPELYPDNQDEEDPDAVDNLDEDEEDRARRLGKEF